MCRNYPFARCIGKLCPHQPPAGGSFPLGGSLRDAKKRTLSCPLFSVCQKTSTLPCRECRGEHCSPANLAQQRSFWKASHKANGHGRAMLAPTIRFFDSLKKEDAFAPSLDCRKRCAHPLAPSARGLRPQAVGERTVRLSEIFRAMARFSPSAPSGHRSPSGASATSPVSGESVSQREVFRHAGVPRWGTSFCMRCRCCGASPAGLRPQARVEAQPPEAALSAETEAGSGPVR